MADKQTLIQAQKTKLRRRARGSRRNATILFLVGIPIFPVGGFLLWFFAYKARKRAESLEKELFELEIR